MGFCGFPLKQAAEGTDFGQDSRKILGDMVYLIAMTQSAA